MNKKKPNDKRALIAWCLYDWANSPFPAIILTFVFSVYFTEKVAANPIIGTALWGQMIAISGLIIAFLSPILGAISDYQNQRKPWVILFTFICIIAAALLWFAYPNKDSTFYTLFCVGLGLVSLEVAMVFYNAMLKDLVSLQYIGRASGFGWGLGYIGGLSCLFIALFGLIENTPSFLNASRESLEQVRAAGPLVAVWFLVFSIPFMRYTKDAPNAPVPLKKAASHGLRELWQTLVSLKQHKNIALFLIAHLLYIDGLNTIFAFGGIYAAGTFNMNTSEVIELGIAMNIAAGLGAIGFAYLDDFWGSKPTILLSLAIMLVTGIGVTIVTSKAHFWILGVTLTLCVGPVQAASRTLMAHLAPREIASQLFGIYALSGKVTTFIGPWLLAYVTFHSGSQRLGVSTIMYFLATGGILLCFVKTPKNPTDTHLLIT